MSIFKVSVIIAVYNAEKFITQAVESALAQPETAEVVLVEDGSPDNSLQVCKVLAEKYEKVYLYQHPGGVNKGAPASFNLGMEKSTYEFLAILGADDYFLPNRFNVAKEIFEKDSNCGGVYEAIGTIVEDEVARKRWLASQEMGQLLITMTKVVPPAELLDRLALGGAGYFSLDGFVFRRNLLKLTGLMDEKLMLHQDTEFLFRLAAVSELLPGRLDEPVAIRRVHIQNRITAPRSKLRVYKDRMKMWKSSYRWFRKRRNKRHKLIIQKALINYCKSYGFGENTESKGQKFEIARRFRLVALPLKFIELLLNEYFWVSFLPTRLRKIIESKGN